MSDPHIDIDSVDAATGKVTEPVEVDFDEDGTFERGQPQDKGGYKFFGFQRLPEMLQDFSNRFGTNLRQSSEDFVPGDTRQYLRNSQREFLMAARSFIDHQLERLEAQQDFDNARATTPRSKPTKIVVEEID